MNDPAISKSKPAVKIEDGANSLNISFFSKDQSFRSKVVSIALILTSAGIGYFGAKRILPDPCNAQVIGNSMFPTFKDGEKIDYITNVTIERGDIVILKDPFTANTFDIKRVIGMPGDKISTKNSLLLVNGVTPTNEIFGKTFDVTPCVVPSNMVYVLGDNRMNSFDSRAFGCIPIDGLKKVMIFEK